VTPEPPMVQSGPERPKSLLGRLVWIVALICLTAVVAWRFVWPWTSATSDVAFIVLWLIVAFISRRF